MKARSFLGYFGLQVGCIVAAVSQAFIGFAIWSAVDYLRPQLRVLGAVCLVLFTCVAILGCLAAYKRRVMLMWSYLGVALSLTIFMLLLSLDFLDAIHFLPTPPARPTTSDDAVHIAPTVEFSSFFGKRNPSRRFLKANHSLRSEHRATPINGPMNAAINGAVVGPMWLTGGVSSWGWLGNGETITTGAEEEVSVDELPPEVLSLPQDLQMTVTATTKTIKHIIKIVCGGCLMIISIWMLYTSWIAMSFALDKCQSFEAVEAMPDQFPAVSRDDIEFDEVVHPSRRQFS